MDILKKYASKIDEDVLNAAEALGEDEGGITAEPGYYEGCTFTGFSFGQAKTGTASMGIKYKTNDGQTIFQNFYFSDKAFCRTLVVSWIDQVLDTEYRKSTDDANVIYATLRDEALREDFMKDIAKAASSLLFDIDLTQDGNFTRATVKDVYES